MKGYENMTKEMRITADEVREFFESCGADPEQYDIEGLRNMYNVIDTFTDHKLSADDIFDSYSFFRNTIQGYREEMVEKVPEEGAIRCVVRQIECIDQTAGKLDMFEKQRYAFCVYYSVYSGFGEFSDPERIKKCFQRDREKNEERYRLPATVLLPEFNSSDKEMNDLSALANTLMDGDRSRLEPRLAEDCVYISEDSGVELHGMEKIFGHISRIHDNNPGIHFSYRARLTGADEDAEFAGRKWCIVNAVIEEHNYSSIAFIDYDDEGFINKITLTTGHGYRFRVWDHLIPENRDDYGLVPDNPIEVKGIDVEYFYLDNLIFTDGSPIHYVRAGSRGGFRVRPVDMFKIYRSKEEMQIGKEPAAEFYIYGYGKECSITAPKGFSFKSNEFVTAVTQPDLFIPDMI